MDLKLALRRLAQNPGFAAVAILTLTLGIGANTAIFSFVRVFILNPSPFPQIERLGIIFETDRKVGFTSAVAPADFADWRDRAGIFDDLAAASFASYNLTGGDEPLRLPGFQVSANFFRTLGVKPALGRDFTPSEETPGQDNVVILSHGLWRDRFGSDPQILGRKIALDGAAVTIIGVMPDNFQYIPMGPADLFTPLALSPQRRQARDLRFLRPVARLKPGIDIARANAALGALQASLEAAYPNSNANRGVLVRSLTEEIGRQAGNGPLQILYAIVCFVLLMACANVANLIMARSNARRKEMAVRLAIGSGRARLVRQLLVETLVLFVAGAAAGVLFARWGVAWIYHAIPARSLPYLPNHGHVEVDSGVLLFTLAIALFTGLAFGLAPALEGTRFNLNSVLKDSGGRGATAGGGRFRRILVAGEMALAVVVVVCGALLVNNFVRLIHVDPGFDGSRILVAELQRPKQTNAIEFADAAVERLSGLPGVERVSVARFTPMSDGGSVNSLYFEGRPDPPPGQAPTARTNAVSPGYLESLSIGLVSGRTISRDDSPTATRAIVINDTIANRFFPSGNPIGKRIRLARSADWYTIVGVVKTIKYYSLASPPENQVYLAFAQAPVNDLTIVVRTAGDPAAVAEGIRSAVRGIDPNQPISRVQTIASRLEERNAPDMILTQLAGFFAILALFLAAVGLYGIMAYSVSQRTQEIGVRMALGARARDILAMIVGQGMKLVLAGMFVGLIGAVMMARALQGFLYGIQASDPATFAVAFLVLSGVAVAACWIPARRAARVDPLVALRYE